MGLEKKKKGHPNTRYQNKEKRKALQEPFASVAPAYFDHTNER